MGALKLPDILNSADKMIRSGQINQAWSLIKDLSLNQLSRDRLLELSNLARRVQQPLFALQALSKFIKRHVEGTDKAKDEEVLAYVGSLIKLGFFRESQVWLNSLDSNKNPQVYDLKARLYIAKWEYSKAARELKKYLRLIKKESYAYLVGSLNLCASLVSSSQSATALKQLKNIQKIAELGGHKLILGNTYELEAQALMAMKSYDDALEALMKSQKILGNDGNIWAFYVRKWRYFIECRQKGFSDEMLARGLRLQKESVESCYWEDNREIDRFLATQQQDQQALIRVYFGTHYVEYQKRLIENYPDKIKIPPQIDCAFLSAGADSKLFDPKAELASSPKLRMLFHVLTQDLYRPTPLGYIFDSIYDEDYFDPFHTPERIYALVRRLREKIGATGLFDIQWDTSGVQLKAISPVRVRLYRKVKADRADDLLPDLRSHFGKKWFTSTEASNFLGTSKTSTARWISRAREIYKMELEGRGKSTRYRFK